MPLVKLLVLTRWDRSAQFPGTTLDVPDDVAARWVKRGIASLEDADEPKPKRRRQAATDEE